MGRAHKELTSAGVRVLAAGPGSSSAAGRVARLLTSPFPLLGDEERTLYQAVGFAKKLGLIQESGTIVTDARHVVTFVHAGANPNGALPMAAIRSAVEGLPPTPSSRGPAGPVAIS